MPRYLWWKKKNVETRKQTFQNLTEIISECGEKRCSPLPCACRVSPTIVSLPMLRLRRVCPPRTTRYFVFNRCYGHVHSTFRVAPKSTYEPKLLLRRVLRKKHFKIGNGFQDNKNIPRNLGMGVPSHIW